MKGEFANHLGFILFYWEKVGMLTLGNRPVYKQGAKEAGNADPFIPSCW